MKLKAIALEDNDSLRTLIYGILKDRGYEVHAFSEPFLSPLCHDYEFPCPEGHICPNIIITDIDMPNMTGFEFIEYQKSKGCKTQHIGIMSGSWTNENIKHAKRLACHMFNKPFKIGEIKKLLDECEKKLDRNSKLIDMQTVVN
ncbi:response regulator [Candidatus Scalindua japonica]|nr:response regulator [Candidatus Scalindua japonica]